jgi:hypothetical protein
MNVSSNDVTVFCRWGCGSLPAKRKHAPARVQQILTTEPSVTTRDDMTMRIHATGDQRPPVRGRQPPYTRWSKTWTMQSEATAMCLLGHQPGWRIVQVLILHCAGT